MNQKRKRKKSLLGTFVKTVLVIVGVFAVCALVAIGAFRYFLGGVEREDVNHDTLQINEELNKYKEMKIVNIALFGLDDSEGGSSRTDAIMVVSVDPAKGKVKMVSVARDTYVSIPGRQEKTKINHAYAYGGAELAMATLNENFKLDITDYVTVDFENMADIINELGGIELDVTEMERKELNRYCDPKSPKLSESAYVKLNGEQAVAYGRIREDDGDDARTDRQRKVMDLLFAKLKALSPLEYPSYIKKFSPMIVTSMSDGEMIKLATVAMSGKNLKLEQDSFPNEYLPGEGQRLGAQNLWYYVYDLNMAAQMLEQFIYEDIPFGGIPKEEEEEET